jgi:hypothetical protein
MSGYTYGETLHDDDGPEDLLLPERAVCADVREDRRREEGAARVVISVQRRKTLQLPPTSEKYTIITVLPNECLDTLQMSL